jgi:beta-lactamase family protein/tetratricopeptide repeat protein
MSTFAALGPALLSLLLHASAAAPAPAPPPATLHYLGHSCFVITTPGGLRLLIDPFSSGEWPGLTFPATRVDRVLVTHPHWDHNAWSQLSGSPRLMDGPGTYTGRDVTVRGFEGRHADLGGAAIGYRNTIFVVETGGLRLCHLGDNGPVTPELAAAIGRVDILMIPVDSEHRVLTVEQAQAWADALMPRVVIPMHYLLRGLAPAQITGIGTVDEWLSAQPAGRDVRRLGSDTLPLVDLPEPGARAVRVLTVPGERLPDPNAPVPGRAEAAEAKRRGELAVAQGDLPTALAEFTRAASIDPDDPDLLQKIGFLHLGSSRPDRALEFLTRAAEAASGKDPKLSSLCWLGAGMALDLLGRREEALAAYRKVIAIGANDEHQVDQARRYLESPYRED